MLPTLVGYPLRAGSSPEQGKCDSAPPDPCAEIPPLTCHPKNGPQFFFLGPVKGGISNGIGGVHFHGHILGKQGVAPGPQDGKKFPHPWLPLAHQQPRDQHRQQLAFPVRTVKIASFGPKASTAIGVVDHCKYILLYIQVMFSWLNYNV